MLSIPGVLFIGSLSTNLFILAESKIFSASSWFSLILSGSVVHFGSSSVSADCGKCSSHRVISVSLEAHCVLACCAPSRTES